MEPSEEEGTIKTESHGVDHPLEEDVYVKLLSGGGDAEPHLENSEVTDPGASVAIGDDVSGLDSMSEHKDEETEKEAVQIEHAKEDEPDVPVVHYVGEEVEDNSLKEHHLDEALTESLEGDKEINPISEELAPTVETSAPPTPTHLPSLPSAGFTQDPFDIQDVPHHSEVPTPESDSETPSIENIVRPDTAEPNPLYPAVLADKTKVPDVVLPLTTEELNELLNSAKEQKKKVFELPPETEKTEITRPVKKSVSIVPHSPEKLVEKLRKAVPMDRDRTGTTESGYDERTPLLLPSSSLPTVVGYDRAGSVVDYPGPSNHSRSEIGRDEMRRKKKRSKRRRYNTERTETIQIPQKTRPFIASPFMPIATQLSVDPDRRSIGNAQSRDANRNGTTRGYGSTRRVEEGQLLKKAEEEEEESSEEDESEGDDGSSSGESLTEQKKIFGSLTSREWVTVITLAVANLCSTVAFSCIAPFYPGEAAMKGMTESQTGMVFGVFELVMFITAPLLGKYLSRIGSKRMFLAGLFITGVTAIMFGFLNYLPSGLFFWASMVVRILESVGDAAFVTSSFAISAKAFPHKIAVVIGILETFAGLGYTAGPLIGGFLYELGGFQLPFIVLGVILLLATLISCFLVEADEDEEISENSNGVVAMLKIPVIWIMIFAIIVCAISLSFLDPTLSSHLASFHLSPTMVGLMFLLCGGIYTISAPVWGLLLDRYHCTISIMVFGTVTTLISMFLIGPSPFIPLEKSLVSIGIALAILGVAAGALYIPTFQNCLDAVKANGFDDSFQTYGCVSGVFQAAFAFGSFMGPTLGGISVEKIGFEWTTSIIGFINIIFIFTLIVYYGTTCCIAKRDPPASRPISVNC